MRRYDLPFLILASVSLLIGVFMGIWMGIVHDFQFAPVHAHLNLLGWVSMALFGIAYRVYPTLHDSPLAHVHFALASVGATVLPIGIGLSIAETTPVVAIAGSFIWLAAVVVFLLNLVRIAVADQPSARLIAAE
jgi:cbb3-type cytochrome oxidase subunit 1